MAKKLLHTIKLELPAGIATPGPPIGALLGSKGISAPQFCKQFNDETQKQKGQLRGVIVYGYDDRTFTFTIGPPSSTTLIKAALKLKKGSSQPNRDKVGTITKEQLAIIATEKKEHTNAHTQEAIIKQLAGTARSMGILVKG